MRNEMPMVGSCQVSSCAFNRGDKCKAMAINVGGPGPDCDTFMMADQKCSGASADAGVGACKVVSCKYNDCLMCAAPGISVFLMGNKAACATFNPR